MGSLCLVPYDPSSTDGNDPYVSMRAHRANRRFDQRLLQKFVAEGFATSSASPLLSQPYPCFDHDYSSAEIALVNNDY